MFAWSRFVAPIYASDDDSPKADISKDTGIRRFRKFYYQVGRKNAKSQDVACCLSYEISAFGESS